MTTVMGRGRASVAFCLVRTRSVPLRVCPAGAVPLIESSTDAVVPAATAPIEDGVTVTLLRSAGTTTS